MATSARILRVPGSRGEGWHGVGRKREREARGYAPAQRDSASGICNLDRTKNHFSGRSGEQRGARGPDLEIEIL